MSDKKLLNESTVRRFMKLANVDTLTNNFIQDRFQINEQEEEPIEDEMSPEPEAEDFPVEDEAPEELEPEMEEDPEAEMGAADISLTEEEAELLIDLGERLKEAMDADAEEDMGEIEDEPMGDEIEEPMEDEAPVEPGMEEEEEIPEPLQENRDAIVREVLKRVTKRVLNKRTR